MRRDGQDTSPRPVLSRGLRYLWASPNTAIGLSFAALARGTGGGVQVVDGVAEAWGGALYTLLRRAPIPGGARAMTIGHVVIGRDQAALEDSRVHERIHVRQYERWGPLFLPAYFASSAWLLLRRRDPYRDNPFEREAYDYDKTSQVLET